jgi:hypothetical protein
LIVISVGCASGTRTVRVAVPPRVDLRAYQTVGLVNFSSNAKGQLDRLSTDKFLQAVQSAQPGTRVVELGAEAQLLASVKRNSFDAAALRAIREAHGVDVLVIGRLDVKKAKQDVQLSTVFKQIAVSSDVDANLTARLIETASGATMWTNAAQCRTNLGHANFNNRGEGTFGASDPEAAYGAMVDGLVVRITDDFRTHYVLRRVRNDDIAVANAGE